MFSIFYFYPFFSSGSADPICPYVRTPMNPRQLPLRYKNSDKLVIRRFAKLSIYQKKTTVINLKSSLVVFLNEACNVRLCVRQVQ